MTTRSMLLLANCHLHKSWVFMRNTSAIISTSPEFWLSSLTTPALTFQGLIQIMLVSYQQGYLPVNFYLPLEILYYLKNSLNQHDDTLYFVFEADNYMPREFKSSCNLIKSIYLELLMSISSPSTDKYDIWWTSNSYISKANWTKLWFNKLPKILVNFQPDIKPLVTTHLNFLLFDSVIVVCYNMVSKQILMILAT